MDRIAAAHARLARAVGLPCILDAAAELAAGTLDEAPCIEGARQANRLRSLLTRTAGP
jgi:hypothetical protein